MKKLIFNLMLTFQVVSINTSAQTITCITTDGPTVFAGTWDDGIYRSSDNGSTWSQIWNTNIEFEGESQSLQVIQSTTIFDLISISSKIYTSTGNGLYASLDKGVTWKTLGYKEFDIYKIPIFSIATVGSELYLGTSNGIYKSKNN